MDDERMTELKCPHRDCPGHLISVRIYRDVVAEWKVADDGTGEWRFAPADKPSLLLTCSERQRHSPDQYEWSTLPADIREALKFA